MSNVRADLYVDMDGVLVHFLKGVKDHTGKDWGSAKTSQERDERNKAVFEHSASWWANLPPMPDYYLLWNNISVYHPYILTAVPHGDGKNPPSETSQRFAREGKWEWNEKYTHVPRERFHCVMREHKANYATSIKNGQIVSNILIDDLDDNIREWSQNRGIGILHKNAVDTLRQLNRLGFPSAGMVA
jgi:hypothetical protein